MANAALPPDIINKVGVVREDLLSEREALGVMMQCRFTRAEGSGQSVGGGLDQLVQQPTLDRWSHQQNIMQEQFQQHQRDQSHSHHQPPPPPPQSQQQQHHNHHQQQRSYQQQTMPPHLMRQEEPSSQPQQPFYRNSSPQRSYGTAQKSKNEYSQKVIHTPTQSQYQSLQHSQQQSPRNFKPQHEQSASKQSEKRHRPRQLLTPTMNIPNAPKLIASSRFKEPNTCKKPGQQASHSSLSNLSTSSTGVVPAAAVNAFPTSSSSSSSHSNPLISGISQFLDQSKQQQQTELQRKNTSSLITFDYLSSLSTAELKQVPKQMLKKLYETLAEMKKLEQQQTNLKSGHRKQEHSSTGRTTPAQKNPVGAIGQPSSPSKQHSIRGSSSSSQQQWRPPQQPGTSRWPQSYQ